MTVTGKNRRTHLLLTVDAVGGVWQYATDLARALVPFGYDTTLALLGPPPTSAMRDTVSAIPGATLVETGLPLDWLAGEPDQVLDAGRMVADLARQVGADLVQLNQPALGAGGAFTVPVVTVPHSCLATWWQAAEVGALPNDFAWRVAQHGQGLAAADRVVAPSLAFARATQQAYRLRALPTVVYNGRAPFALPAAAMHDFAFTAGRLWDRGKNLATLDRAAARLGVPIKAAGATQGPNGTTVQFSQLCAIGTVDHDTLAGLLAARPVFVSAARYEPFGLAVLEAAAAGCALVLSDIPTFRELWDEAAIFVAPDDDRGFAHAIEAIIGDTALRLNQGEKARSIARRYTPERMAAGMAAIYAELLPAPVSSKVAA